MTKQETLMDSGSVDDQTAAAAAAARGRTWRGWPHILVQGLFCVITVASFILIISTSMSKSSWLGPGRRCVATSCQVTCSGAPHYGQYEGDVADAVKEQNQLCKNVQLTLNNAMFSNGTIPRHWMANVPYRITKLAIVGGNPKFISPGAFMSDFTKDIESLSLEDVRIAQWDRDTLLGLMKLTELNIVDSDIQFVDMYALRPVQATLREFSIRSSGHWNPINFTGSSELLRTKVVNFSFNNFSDIIAVDTFSQLHYCEELILASSRITAIEAGAFNHMTRIKMIKLNNNLLQTLPMGLFSSVVAAGIPLRVNLQDNNWKCSCDLDELRILSINNRIVSDPVCNGPEQFYGLTLSSVGTFCNHSSITRRSFLYNFTESSEDNEKYVILESECASNRVRLEAPLFGHECFRQLQDSANTLRQLLSSSELVTNNTSLQEWLRPNYFIRDAQSSVLELKPTTAINTGLFWYLTTCPDTLYCVDDTPTYLRIYNVHTYKEYTLCQLSFENLASLSCMRFTPAYVVTIQNNFGTLSFIGGMMAACLFGALIVYLLIRRHPTLMKGSKRVLIVKQRIADALVLPPNVPARITEERKGDVFENRTMAMMRKNKLYLTSESGANSIRSERSASPSYISVVQPEEVVHGCGRHPFDPAGISWIYATESPCYSVYSTIGSVRTGPR